MALVAIQFVEHRDVLVARFAHEVGCPAARVIERQLGEGFIGIDEHRHASLSSDVLHGSVLAQTAHVERVDAIGAAIDQRPLDQLGCETLPTMAFGDADAQLGFDAIADGFDSTHVREGDQRIVVEDSEASSLDEIQRSSNVAAHGIVAQNREEPKVAVLGRETEEMLLDFWTVRIGQRRDDVV